MCSPLPLYYNFVHNCCSQVDDGLFLLSMASNMMFLRLPRLWSSVRCCSTVFADANVVVVVVFEPSDDCSEDEEDARFVRFNCLLQNNDTKSIFNQNLMCAYNINIQKRHNYLHFIEPLPS